VLLRELDYARPGSVEDAVKLLAAREDARALAGGQSLVNVMKTRVAAPELVVDLNGIDALRGVEEDSGALVIGAMTTYAGIVGSPEVAHISSRLVREVHAGGGDVGHFVPPLVAQFLARRRAAGGPGR